jgi:uncharacterized membrane protein
MKNLSNSCSYTRSILSVGFLCLLLLSTARGQTSYTITDIGTLGGSVSQAFGINNRGQIVGESSWSSASKNLYAPFSTAVAKCRISITS